MEETMKKLLDAGAFECEANSTEMGHLLRLQGDGKVKVWYDPSILRYKASATLKGILGS